MEPMREPTPAEHVKAARAQRLGWSLPVVSGRWYVGQCMICNAPASAENWCPTCDKGRRNG